MLYEKLLNEAYRYNVDVSEQPMKRKIKGLYSDNVIWINKRIDTTIEKTCVLAEELGHFHTTTGDILDQSKVLNRKQERRARIWAAEKIMPLDKFIDAFNKGCSSRYEIAEYFEVTESFLKQSLDFYRQKYGNEVQINDQHILYLAPLAVYKII